MTRKTLEQLALGHAIGTLEPDEAAQLEALLIHDAEAREEVGAFIDTAAAIAAAASPGVPPSPRLRAQILTDIVATPQAASEAAAPPELPAAYRIVSRSDEGWTGTDIPGFRTKPLSSGPQPGYQVMLIALDRGASVPDHDHEGTEEIYMLSGHLQTEGRLLGPGDYLKADAGSHHYEASSPDGCVALLILCPALAA
ncbi:MAG: cupin domain-containing protein [Terrimicrobiaceae bacterium]|nr:cupin domain-containing protein [Terrimicrobiaceae bacterium]